MGIFSATIAVQPDIASRRQFSGLSPPREFVHRVPSPKVDRQRRPHKPQRTNPEIASDTQPCALGAQQETRWKLVQSGP
jgi:hypothetical protein